MKESISLEVVESIVEKMIKKVFLPLFNDIDVSERRVKQELLYRQSFVFDTGEWPQHIKSVSESVKAQLNALTGHHLIKLWDTSIDATFLNICEQACVEDWKVLNLILTDKILEDDGLSGSEYRKIKKLPDFSPLHYYKFKIKCTFCDNNWVHKSLGKTNPNAAFIASQCPTCGNNGKSLPKSAREVFSDAMLSNMIKELNKSLSELQFNLPCGSHETPDKFIQYDNFIKHHSQIPPELHDIIFKLQKLYKNKQRNYLTINEFPLEEAHPLCEKYIHALQKCGVIDIVKTIDWNRTVIGIASSWFVHCYATNRRGSSSHVTYFTAEEIPKLDNNMDWEDWRVETIIKGHNPEISIKNIYVLNKHFMEAVIKKEVPKEITLASEKSSIQSVISDERRVIVVTTSHHSDGFIDFIERLRIEQTCLKVFLGREASNHNALSQYLANIDFHDQDIVAIVRGGGDLSHKTFTAFNSADAKTYISRLTEKGIIVVTGLGHSTNTLSIDEAANYSESTPTKAAERVNKLVNVRSDFPAVAS
ncbi:hypothetical protein MT390_02375 [Vibrio sp. 2-Bac 85]